MLRTSHWTSLVSMTIAVACAPENAPEARAVGSRAVGFRQISLEDPRAGIALDVGLWYPTHEEGSEDNLEGVAILLARDGAPSESRGLVIVSHGFSGSFMGHWDLAVALVGRGYTVGTLTHPDLWGTRSEDWAKDPLVMRPHQVAQIIEAARADSLLAPSLAEGGLALIGYSMGGYTALAALGAQPTLENLSTYCESVPGDQVLCADWSEGRFANIEEHLGMPALPDVSALVLLAPGYGPLFSSEALSGVSMPALIYRAEGDLELVEPHHAEHIASNLGGPVSLKVIPQAGHFVFLAPCDHRPQAPAVLCADPPGVDRAAIHRELNAAIASFLDEELVGSW